MTKLQRMRNLQTKRTMTEHAQYLANATGQPQVVVKDRTNNQPRILPYAIRKEQPGGRTMWPRREG